MDYFDAQHQGGSASRSEDNFIRIRDLLRTGLIPGDPCAGLDEALALIPGAHTSDQTNSKESLGRYRPIEIPAHRITRGDHH